MDGLELSQVITDALLDKQGEDILVLDLQGLTSLTDYFVICSATSHRQLDALEWAVRERLKKAAEEAILPRGVEGTPDSGWVLLDYGDVVVHLFSEEMRRYYDLEGLWSKGRVVTRIH